MNINVGWHQHYQCRLWVLWCVVLSSAASGEDSMNDQRLFFTDHQRQEIDRSNTSDAKYEAIVPSVSKKHIQSAENKKPLSAMKNISMPTATHVSTVFFNGFVASNEKIQVIINGLPCQPMQVTETDEAELPTKINCPHLNRLPFNYLLSRHADQLIVEFDNATKARLGQGDGF